MHLADHAPRRSHINGSTSKAAVDDLEAILGGDKVYLLVSSVTPNVDGRVFAQGIKLKHLAQRRNRVPHPFQALTYPASSSATSLPRVDPFPTMPKSCPSPIQDYLSYDAYDQLDLDDLSLQEVELDVENKGRWRVASFFDQSTRDSTVHWTRS
ncbi:hypothetical protein IAR55_007178 [Kwoniella newhampshirensis]|uniref:Uncharacterized protein n=1 Tax=Kwoniella newhampshirensis TaxID=1651941 RepID=A0AAW0YSG9_9TREE